MANRKNATELEKTLRSYSFEMLDALSMQLFEKLQTASPEEKPNLKKVQATIDFEMNKRAVLTTKPFNRPLH